MTRRYGKGERRFKHVGFTSEAEIVFETGNPMCVSSAPELYDSTDF